MPIGCMRILESNDTHYEISLVNSIRYRLNFLQLFRSKIGKRLRGEILVHSELLR